MRFSSPGQTSTHLTQKRILECVGTQECTQIGKNDLSASFWVICVHYCDRERLQNALFRRMLFFSPGQMRRRLTERRTLRHRLTERRILQPASWTKHPLHDLRLSKLRFT